MDASIAARNESRDADRAKKMNGSDKRDKDEKKAKAIDTRKKMAKVDRNECTRQGKCPYYQAGVCGYGGKCTKGAHKKVVSDHAASTCTLGGHS